MTERLHYINKEVNKVKEESEKVGLKLNIQKSYIESLEAVKKTA